MVIFSFIVNLVLIIVLLALGVLIFEIKNEVAQPLVAGLHSSFVGLDQATIDTTIPVRDEIQVNLTIPLKTDTVVTLNEPVPLTVNALIDLPGINAYGVQAVVNLQLPAGLALPVALDLEVEVDQPMPIALDVRAVIPLQDTQLHDVADSLRLLFEPLARALYALPSDFGEAGDLVGDMLKGDFPDLLAENDYSRNPWPGYSLTAGVGYDLYTEPIPPENRPIETGIVPIGGIPFMDEELRPDVYAAGGPRVVNDNANANMAARNVGSQFYNGGIGQIIADSITTTTSGTAPVGTGGEDAGIIGQQPPPDTGVQATPVPTQNPDDAGIIAPPGG
jgi:hypothetical protein